MTIGYARVSMRDQNLDLQINALSNHGCDLIYQEKQTGKNTDRPELTKLLNHIQPNDTLVIYKLDRLGRSTIDLINITKDFEDKNITLISLTEKLDTSNPMGRFFFRLTASLAELERERIVERTRAGLEAARLKGKKGGRKPITPDKIETIRRMWTNDVKDICRATQLKRPTVYKYINILKQTDPSLPQR